MCAILMEQEQELTIVQVAHRLGISVDTVKRRIDTGRIKARKEGREWRIRESDLKQYIESGFEERHGDSSRRTKPRDTDKYPIIHLHYPEQELGR